MNKILNILFILIGYNSYGQICDTVEGKFFNCFDINGRRQGFWKVQEKIIDHSSYSGLGTKGGCRYYEEFHFETLSEGFYNDDIKVGTWKYYNNEWNSYFLEKEINYNKGGTFTVKNLIDSSTIEYSNDSSIIEGFVLHKGDTINIAFSSEICSFKLYKHQAILAFDCSDLDKFEYELLRLKYGLYDRKINVIKFKY
jgi:hypothetical protein